MTQPKKPVSGKKTPPSFTPRMLRPEEIEALGQDNKRRHKVNVEMLEIMELSHLME
ncbi:hypothetical protein [Zobellella maritima]|uniref:hypothetical protein n=1 Tax=Zobellella maritima TaxID=2059725 RepID=UPI001300BB24|nr:hypothetical protein [Zobellella maritima]